VFSYDIVDDADMRRIKIRSVRYLERLHSSTGMYHLAEDSRVRLTPLKGGLPVARIATEHEADEIAAALHAEVPWMAPPFSTGLEKPGRFRTKGGLNEHLGRHESATGPLQPPAIP